MSPEQIAAITRSFQHLLLSEDTFAALFYRRLFTLDPALMPLFGADMQAQGRTFCRMLHYLAVRLPDSGQLCRDLHELGRRHRNYGVRAEQYVTFGAALHWALQQVLNGALHRRCQTGMGIVLPAARHHHAARRRDMTTLRFLWATSVFFCLLVFAGTYRTKGIQR